MEKKEKAIVYKQFTNILAHLKQLNKSDDFGVFSALCDEYYEIVQTSLEETRSVLMVKMLMEEIQEEVDRLTEVFSDEIIASKSDESDESLDRLKDKPVNPTEPYTSMFL